MKKVRNVDVKLAERAVRSRARKRAARANYLQLVKQSAHSSAGVKDITARSSDG